MTQTKTQQYAHVVLRIGLCLVYFWFGYHQITDPDMWIRIVPDWATAVTPALVIIKFNGWFEIIAGIILLVGWRVRVVASLLAIHLGIIAISLGWAPSGIRDFGLTIATIATALYGADIWSLDWKRLRKAN
jgi:uncharacterized membrane protein YphA (DoxX/SURF4 family)